MGLGMTSQSYAEALEIFRKHYEDSVRIKQTHWEKLKRLPMVKDNLSNLEKFIDELRATTLVLRRQNVTSEVLDAFVVDTMKKLPESLVVDMEKMRMIQGEHDEDWKMEDLIRSLEGFAKIDARMQTNKRTRSNVAAASFAVTQEKGKNVNREVVPVRVCAFCKGNHFHDECKMIKNVEERCEIAKKEGRCYSCFNTNHRASDCRRRKPCFHCKKMGHHSVLCKAQTKGTNVRPW